MKKINWLIIPFFIFMLSSYTSKGQSNYDGEDCGPVEAISHDFFELPSRNSPERANLNKIIDFKFKLGDESYSFHLKNDNSILIHYYMFDMLHEAKRDTTLIIGVRYKEFNGKKKIVSMAFCEEKNETEECNCFIE